MKKLVFGAVAALVVATPAAGQTRPAVNQFGNPLKLAPRPTTPAITEADLKTRLYIFSDDSMMGRQAGREGNRKGTDYIARELQRLGIQPGGDGGTYFQRLPSVVRKYVNWSSITVDGQKLRWEPDFVAVPPAPAAPGPPPRVLNRADVIFGGMFYDSTVTPEQAAGKILVFTPAPPGAGRAGRAGGGGGAGGRGGQTPPLATPQQRYPLAAAIAIVDLDPLTPSQRAFINNPISTVDVMRIPL